MDSKKAFYITTTLPYVNSDPHVGFAMEIIRADSIARYKKLMGYDVFFNTGTDEHGLKIHRKAEEQQVDTQAYVDSYASKFKGLKELLGLSDDIHFIRTTDVHHKKAAQEFWNRCDQAGDIYKKTYQIKYCVGCELEKTDSELVNGTCSIHPNLKVEIIDEENYFFRFSKYQKKLLELYGKNPHLVVPDFRFNEIKAFVERGLEDFSISRLKQKMPWGVPVPGDDDQVMYVWFDALVNYISTLGWPEDGEAFKKYWIEGTPVQYCGKDNLRQQSAMWQAMLMSAGLPPTDTIVIDGFITSGGQKMSKSLGNVISPYDLVKAYTDVTDYPEEVFRYYVARELNPFEDSDMTPESLQVAYNSGLANGIGNLTSRILKMSTTYEVVVQKDKLTAISEHLVHDEEAYRNFNLKQVLDAIWKDINDLDLTIQTKQPFKKIKENPKEAKADVEDLLLRLRGIACRLAPCMPKTSQAICTLIEQNKMPEKPLFARKD